MLTAQSPPSPHSPPPPSSAAELHAHSPHPAARCGPQPTGPPLLSPRAAGFPLLPFSMPWGQQLSWLSVRSYPLCRNLRWATLLPSSPAGPRCHGAGWEPRSVVTGEKQRGKETGAQIWLCFAFFLPLVIFTKLSFFSHHTLNSVSAVEVLCWCCGRFASSVPHSDLSNRCLQAAMCSFFMFNLGKHSLPFFIDIWLSIFKLKPKQHSFSPFYFSFSWVLSVNQCGRSSASSAWQRLRRTKSRTAQHPH